MSDYAYLPEVLAEIAEAAGLQAALKIAEARAGCQIYIPVRAPDGHWLVECVGRKAADQICAYFAARIDADAESSHHGTAVLIPLNGGFYKRARRQAEKLMAEGKSRAEIARAVGVHIRTVDRIKSRRKETEKRNARQRSLF